MPKAKQERIRLYHHKTDGGAEYLYDTYIDTGLNTKTGKVTHREGVITDWTKYIVRIDGDITKDAELTVRDDERAALVAVAKAAKSWQRGDAGFGCRLEAALANLAKVQKEIKYGKA